jgi:hypothetical protein
MERLPSSPLDENYGCKIKNIKGRDTDILDFWPFYNEEKK